MTLNATTTLPPKPKKIKIFMKKKKSLGISQSTANIHSKQHPDKILVNRSGEILVKSFEIAVNDLNILKLPKLKFK
jgi:hypothetical protein